MADYKDHCDERGGTGFMVQIVAAVTALSICMK